VSTGAVVITAAAGSFPGLSDALRALPAEVIEIPLLTFAAPPDWTEVDRAISELRRYSAIAFTSPRAAAAFGRRWEDVGSEPLPPVWAAGRRTASALRPVTDTVRTAPEDEVGRIGAAAAVAAAMLQEGLAGPVLFPCGEIRRDELPTRLRQEGIEVDEVVCYHSVVAGDEAAREAVRLAGILVVASPSVAELLARASVSTPRPPLLAVGPTTAAAARAAGWTPAAVAGHPEVDALVAEVRRLIAEPSAR
jgi:uroporphyrinogen-III synthase